MIKEAYCSFEVAKLLKEKGFVTPCDWLYCNDGTFGHRNSLWDKEMFPAPTHQMAMAWLRQEKDIIINVWYDGGDWNAEYYNNEDENFHLITCLCNSYEEAVEVALKYCLENLI